MINIGILYDTKVQFNRKKPFIGRVYNRDYSSLLTMGLKFNINFYLAPYTAYAKKSFKQAWIYRQNWQKVKNIKLDAIFDKVDGDEGFSLKKKIDQQLPLVNRFAFDLLCTDKWLLEKKWPQFLPQTYLGNDLKNIKKIKSDLLIIKPRTGASGRGIYIQKKDNYQVVSKDYIVQGLIKGGRILNYHGQHDFRVLVGNGKILYSTMRIPVKKKYISNVGQGGNEFYYPPNKIPKKILKIVLRIDRDLKKFNPRLYSIDFMINDKGAVKIIELNSRPGLTHYSEKKVIKILHEFVCLMFNNLRT